MGIEYRCEDLAEHGIVLVPPTSPGYDGLLADIQQRLANPVLGSPPKLWESSDPDAPEMILCNRSQQAIAAVSWIWKLELESGQSTREAMPVRGIHSVVAPFGLDDRVLKLYGYWHTILSGSKRGIRGNSMFGDNTDVRPPQPDKLWTGGILGGSGGSRRARGPLKSVTLALDGVFFLDGGFAGPDTLYTFDQTIAEVDAYLQVAKIARDGYGKGLSSTAIFARIEELTGPGRGPAPPPPPRERTDFRQSSLQMLAFHVGWMRQHGGGNDRVIRQLASWAGTPVANFRKLPAV